MSTLTDTIQIENVVASTDLSQELALEQLATDLPGAEYNPGDFPGVIYRLDDPKSATLIFDSGKAVCTGAQSVDDVHDAISIVVEDLRDLGIDIPPSPPVHVQNIVCSGSLDQDLNLNAIASDSASKTSNTNPNSSPASSIASTTPMLWCCCSAAANSSSRVGATQTTPTTHSRSSMSGSPTSASSSNPPQQRQPPVNN